MLDKEEITLNRGLSEDDARSLLAIHGPNELTSQDSHPLWSIALSAMCEPMFLLLFVCAGVYLFLGDQQEAVLLSVAILFVFSITLVQEYRAEKTLDRLRNLSSPRARVVRDGVIKRIAGRDVVPGDTVLVSEGDRIPVDGTILASYGLQVDESAMTGESIPVEKTEHRASDALNQHQTSTGKTTASHVFLGTLVVQGRAFIKTQATGAATEMGRIGRTLAETKRPASPLQKDVRKVVIRVAIASIAISLVLGFMMVWRTGDMVQGLLAGLALAMGTIPEEFPVVMTVFMAFGAWRISRQRVLTRQTNAIETLGATTFLCVDKTGTLTENRMRVTQIWTEDGLVETPESLNVSREATRVVAIGALASHAETFDPMDKALLESYRNSNSHEEKRAFIPKSAEPKHVYALTKTSRSIAQAWDGTEKETYFIALKGAPESVIKLCHLAEPKAAAILQAATNMAARGLRVLGIAAADLTGKLPDSRADILFHFSGLIGFADPVRSGVPEAVRQCHGAGIDVMMMTGDFPITASSVARDIGLRNPSDVLTGEELAKLDDSALSEKLKHIRVLARMVPEQKLRVVMALSRQGEVVAMTGDGVNDAPALKAAHIGVAMGERGTDVAREAAAIVLLDDDFTSIVSAIRLGRRIYDNMQKAVCYIIAIHIPIVGLATVPVFSGLPILLLPVHIAFLELIVDPACSLAFEAEPAEDDIMMRRPRRPDASIFQRLLVYRSLLTGLVVLMVTMGLFLTVLKFGKTSSEARAMVFAALVCANMGLILAFRSRTKIGFAKLRSNRVLIGVVSLNFAMLAAVLWVPTLRGIFHFEHLHADDFFVSLSLAGVSVGLVEAGKFFKRG